MKCRKWGPYEWQTLLSYAAYAAAVIGWGCFCYAIFAHTLP